MDDDSKMLVEMFTTDEEIKSVLFAFCYRDKAASAVADILQTSPSRSRRITDIPVSSLDFRGVRSMVTSKLQSLDEEDIGTLSELATKDVEVPRCRSALPETICLW